jgi:hypothetical protein
MRMIKFDRNAPVQFLAGMIGLAIVGTLTACGGSEGEGANSDSDYYFWPLTTTGVVILDANDERFAMRIDNRAVVEYANGKALSGLTITGAGDLMRSGTKIGGVVLGSSNGQPAVGFFCPNLRPLDLRVTGTNWTYVCT